MQAQDHAFGIQGQQPAIVLGATRTVYEQPLCLPGPSGPADQGLPGYKRALPAEHFRAEGGGAEKPKSSPLLKPVDVFLHSQAQQENVNWQLSMRWVQQAIGQCP